MTLGLNLFAHLTMEEITNIYLSKPPPFNFNETSYNEGDEFPVSTFNNIDLLRHPPSLDWRTWGGVQVVKNQGSCGSSYAFSAAGALETTHWIKYNTLPNLSEQHILDCTVEYGNNGCGGGWMDTSFRWIKDKGGYVSQSDYPYKGELGPCLIRPKSGTVNMYKRIFYEGQLLDAVATVGTVSIAYNAGTKQHAYYRSGILDVPNCGTTPTHAALLIGYGSENGVDFWVLKNSWGSSWGERGFFRMRRGVNLCGVASWASVPYVH
eukprot:gene5194-6465_t